jgi:hypothetical protein
MLNYEPRYGEYIISRGFQPSDPDQLHKRFLKSCFLIDVLDIFQSFLIQLTFITLHNSMGLVFSIDLRSNKLSYMFQSFMFDPFLHKYLKSNCLI